MRFAFPKPSLKVPRLSWRWSRPALARVSMPDRQPLAEFRPKFSIFGLVRAILGALFSLR
jgi:hypothetical protein